MPNGYKVIQVDGGWKLKCKTTELPEVYDSELKAHAAALQKTPCTDKLKLVLVPKP